MRFPVGPFEYVVGVTRHRPVGPDGREAEGLIDFEEQMIYLHAGLSPRRRLSVLLHELWHAKRYHLGAPGADEEADCDLSSAFVQQVMECLERQGGVDELGRMKPGEGVASTLEAEAVEGVEAELFDETEEGDGSGEVEGRRLVPIDEVWPADDAEAGGRYGTARLRACVCGQMVYERRIVSATPRYEAKVGGWVVDRVLCCPECWHLQYWTEGVGPDGLPNGVATDEPVIVRDREKVEAFLAEHPQARGVLEVC